MTNRPALLRQIYTEARPYVEQLVELNVAFTGFRKLATDNGLDWGQIKALLRAEIEDGEEGGSEKVDRIIQKAEYASEYAALLGLGTSNMNERNSISADLPPHDEDGVIIEPASAPSDAEAGQGDAPERGPAERPWLRPSSVAPPTDPEAKATEVEPGTAGEQSPRKTLDHRASVASRLADGRTSAGEGAEPSGDDAPHHVPQSGAPLTPDAPGSSPGPVPVETPGALNTSDPYAPQARDGRLTEKETGDPVGSGAASAGFLIAGKSPDPIAPIPGPADEWADLDIPAQFIRRPAAA